MRTILLLLGCAVLAGCSAGLSRKELKRLKEDQLRELSLKHEQSLLDDKNNKAIDDQKTAKLKSVKTKKLQSDYYTAMFLTIAKLDDGVTSPDVIARACIGKNLTRLTNWKKSVLEQQITPPITTWHRMEIDKLLLTIPTQKQVDIATGAVLEHRKREGGLNAEGEEAYRRL